jgi:hypothetical protein
MTGAIGRNTYITSWLGVSVVVFDQVHPSVCRPAVFPRAQNNCL